MLNLIVCDLCKSKITPKKQCVWLGDPTYCVLCWYFSIRPKIIEDMQKQGMVDKKGRVLNIKK